MIFSIAPNLTSTTYFDPEALHGSGQSSSSDEQSEAGFLSIQEDSTGREHYTIVEESRLRKKEQAALGAAYAGRGVSRHELENSDTGNSPKKRSYSCEESREAIQIVENGDSSWSESQSEEKDERQKRSTRRNSKKSKSDESDQASSQASDSDDEKTESHGNGVSRPKKSRNSARSDVPSIRKLMRTNSPATILTTSTQSDMTKGHAVKEQQKIFDSLLGTRIQLQKALISTNSMTTEIHKANFAPDAALEAAEAAALTLLNTITNLRLSQEQVQAGRKRKHIHFASDLSGVEIWHDIQIQEASASRHRKLILEHWSRKTATTAITTGKANLMASAQQNLNSFLDAQLGSPHLVERTQIPRSCAPIQASDKSARHNQDIFDDTDFYGLLLKELLEQRSAIAKDSNKANFTAQASWELTKGVKTKKNIDTKASKGRKLRYSVHEKLQNFTAPEERGVWPDQQRDEFFSGLFGRRLELGGQNDEESDRDGDEETEETGSWFLKS